MSDKDNRLIWESLKESRISRVRNPGVSDSDGVSTEDERKDWPEIDPDMPRSERWDIAEDMLKAGEDTDKIKELLFPDMGRYDWSANISYMRGGDYPGKHGERLD
ncbi:hypothetical protein CL634_02730 [bacterium]|nr:hypothetical protein [bacterium]|tara:strand:+ start:1599 stop:1913 length:315 start_codon:yes stop_codon:yes gene_type:complete